MCRDSITDVLPPNAFYRQHPPPTASPTLCHVVPNHFPIEFTLLQVQLPPDLAAFVAEANGRFQAEIAAWDVSHAGNCAVPAAPATASQEVRDDP